MYKLNSNNTIIFFLQQPAATMDKLVRESQKDQVIGQMVRIKKGQEKPEAFRLMTDNEVLQMQMKIIFNWKPHSQM